jgi:hypothetical protein
MKLTKSQLMTVINEELEQLDEWSLPWGKAVPVDFNTNWEFDDFQYGEPEDVDPLISLNQKLKGKKKWEALRPTIDTLARSMGKYANAIWHLGGSDREMHMDSLQKKVDWIRDIVTKKTTPEQFLRSTAHIYDSVLKMMAYADENLARQAKAAAEEAAERAQRAWEKGAPERKARAHRQKEKDDWAAEVAYRDKYGSPQTRDFHRANPGTAGTANLGYGEGIERAELEKIIREELNGMLK